MKQYYPHILILLLFFTITSCDNDSDIMSDDDQMENIPPIPTELNGPYEIQGAQILNNDETVFYKGVNALQTYGLGDQSLMNQWNIEIVREFIGNLREQPIDGFAIQGSDQVWYHPLQNIVDGNRANNKITILCPFGWVDDNGERTLFTGLNPTDQNFYNDYKIKMAAIATHFKDQPDVWIQVWNEPYSWQNINGYTHELWLADMKDMVDNLRWVDGFQNIIVVPGNEQGQSENAILDSGSELLDGRYNLLFDLHAYEKWLLNTTTEELVQKIENIHNNDFAFIIGEVGVENATDVMPVQHFLDAAIETEISVLAWLWNKNTEDTNALLTDEGLPNATDSNNFWGTKFQSFLTD